MSESEAARRQREEWERAQRARQAQDDTPAARGRKAAPDPGAAPPAGKARRRWRPRSWGSRDLRVALRFWADGLVRLAALGALAVAVDRLAGGIF